MPSSFNFEKKKLTALAKLAVSYLLHAHYHAVFLLRTSLFCYGCKLQVQNVYEMDT
jgi:hypothetical protein